MTDNDKKEFALMMHIVCSNYNHKELDKETLRYWFSKLEKHDLPVVSGAFDSWIDTNKYMPTIKDIIDACKPKPTIFSRIASPLAIAENHRHAVEVKEAVAKMTKPKRDMKAWARKILESNKIYPDISIRYAKEALGMVEHKKEETIEND